MIRILWSLVIAAQVPLLFWLGGFDFDHRGEVVAMCVLSFWVVFCFTLICQLPFPGEKK